MKYLNIQREKSWKYSQGWQQRHAADELKTVAQAVNYLAELDASLSSVSEKSGTIRSGMKELQKLIEQGKNHLAYKPIHDEHNKSA